MGGSCSLHRQRVLWEQQRDAEGRSLKDSPNTRRDVRHAVHSQVPDQSVAKLYPLADNYVVESGGSRSPKSLVELSLDAVCRSLPNMDGELPPGLPQDIVDSIVKSLTRHAALNATTLRALRHCEVGELSLAGCRGVTDEWLQPLGCSSSVSSSPSFGSPSLFDSTPTTKGPPDMVDPMDLDVSLTYNDEAVDERSMLLGNEGTSSSCSTSSFVSASSTPYDSNNVSITDGADKSSSFASLLVEDLESFRHPSPTMMGTSSLPSITSNLTLLDLRGSQRLTDRGLMQLGDLQCLEVVKLDNCHSLVGRGFVVFSNSNHLHTLSLANCRRLTDEAILNISHLTSITALSLDGCRCLTDRSLAAISNMHDICKLDLSQCDLITDEGLAYLHDLEFIQELSLGWCRCITDLGIHVLSHQPSRGDYLRTLRLARCLITDLGISHLSKFLSLEDLDLNGCSQVGSEALGQTLEKLTNLTSLDVSYCPQIMRCSWQGKIKSLKSLELCYSDVKNQDISKLTSLPELEELNLDSCRVGDWAIAHFADNNVVPNLTTLDLADTEISDIGMTHLPKFQKLTRLSLFYCDISNHGLRHLASMTNLETLNLDSREISDDGLAYLRNLTALRSLDIFSGRITDVGCVHISKIKSLESLELCGGGIGDHGCGHLATLENLTSLNLSQNERITNRGAACLAALKNLKALNLSNTHVNSAAVRFLGELVKLQSLALYGCRGIEDSSSLNTLQSDLPSLKCLRLNSGTLDGQENELEEDHDSDVDDDMLSEDESSSSESAVSQEEHVGIGRTRFGLIHPLGGDDSEDEDEDEDEEEMDDNASATEHDDDNDEDSDDESVYSTNDFHEL